MLDHMHAVCGQENSQLVLRKGSPHLQFRILSNSEEPSNMEVTDLQQAYGQNKFFSKLVPRSKSIQQE